MRALALALLLPLAACATPRIQTVEVKVPVPTPCPDRRLPAGSYPDNPAAVAKVAPGDIGGLVKLLLEGRTLRDERLSEDNAQIEACARS